MGGFSDQPICILQYTPIIPQSIIIDCIKITIRFNLFIDEKGYFNSISPLMLFEQKLKEML
jgi:hypothetical protein